MTDFTRLTDDEFRRLIRCELEENYPSEIRFPPRRLYWREQEGWYRRMASKGWLAPNWPVEYGGMGLTPRQYLIFMEEHERWGVARYQDHGVTQVGPVLIQYGTKEQREQWLPYILTLEHRWSQGYSEPEAGSDLAALRTRARQDSEGWVINGQKIWSTFAHDTTHMYVLARTSDDPAKQKGISFFLLDLMTPGVTVRPIRDIAGYEEFCEVFFDEVRVPPENLVGGEGDGWGIAKSLLSHERINIGSPKVAENGLRTLLDTAHGSGAADDPVFMAKVNNVRLDIEHLGMIYEKFARRVDVGDALGPEVSLLKILATEIASRIANLTIEAAGPAGALGGLVAFGDQVINVLAPYYKSRAAKIYGGTNEIQRNILAKRVLSLPDS